MAKAGRPRKAKTKVLYVRLREPIEKAVRDKAEQDRRGLAATVELMIEFYLDAQKDCA